MKNYQVFKVINKSFMDICYEIIDKVLGKKWSMPSNFVLVNATVVNHSEILSHIRTHI